MENENEMSDRMIVYVGRKPVMSYVLAVLTSLNQKGSDKVIIKARGRAITTAVDTAEVTRRYFGRALETTVNIGTEQMPQEEGGSRNVSTMEIILKSSGQTGSQPEAQDESSLEKVQEEEERGSGTREEDISEVK